MRNRMEPEWKFSNFFLIKDSLALMLESVGLFEDSLKEYLEVKQQ